MSRRVGARRQGIGSLVSILVLTVGLVLTTIVGGWSPLLGLDLQGGVSVVLQPTGPTTEDSLNQAVDIIRRRVDGLGVAEPEVTRQGDTILVQIPGVDDPDRALELVGQTAELRFRPVLSVVAEADLQALAEAPTTTVDPTGTTTGPTTTTTASDDGATTTTGPAPEGTGDTVVPPSTTAGDEVGLGTGDLAAAQVAPTATTAPPTTDGATTTTAPDDGATTTTVAPGDEVPVTTVPPVEVDPLAQLAITAPEDDVAEEQVVLPEYGPDGEILFRYVLGPAGLKGESLESASHGLQGTEWVVRPIFKSGPDGIDGFNALATECNTAQPTCPTGRLAITLDGEVVSAPNVQQPTFSRDGIVISGSFDEREAKDVALVLNYGALPIELEAQQSQIVSATLGSDALRAGLIAGAVGVLLAATFMVLYYRLLGVVAVMSLAVSAGLLWSIIAWLGESQGLALTLAGITGIIVSIGVSLDSNVVYYEHIKEDVRHGRTVRSAVDRGFTSAFSTIVKADVASLIGATLLYLLSIGSVRGFALYLGIATLLDLVASWFFMRPMVRLLAGTERVQRSPGLLGIRLSAEEAA